jgi:hypothetical protein
MPGWTRSRCRRGAARVPGAGTSGCNWRPTWCDSLQRKAGSYSRATHVEHARQHGPSGHREQREDTRRHQKDGVGERTRTSTS